MYAHFMTASCKYYQIKLGCHFQGRHPLIEVENIRYTWIYIDMLEIHVGVKCSNDRWLFSMNINKTHPLTLPPTLSLTPSLIPSLIPSLTHSLLLSFTHSFTHSLSLTLSFILSLTLSLTLTHWLTHSSNRLPLHPTTQFHTSLTSLTH